MTGVQTCALPICRRVRLPRGFMGAVPDWAAETAYFKALAADGKLVVSASKSDKELEKERN